MDKYIHRTVLTRRTHFIIVSQTRFIILSPFVLCFYNKCFLNTFPEVVCVCVSAPVISVFNIAVMFVQRIETKSQHPKALIKEQQTLKNSFVFCVGGSGDPSSPA